MTSRIIISGGLILTAAAALAAGGPAPELKPIPVVGINDVVGTPAQAEAFIAQQAASWIYDEITYTLSRKDGVMPVARTLLTAMPLQRSESGLTILSNAGRELARIDAHGAVELRDDVYEPSAVTKLNVPQVQTKPEYPFEMRRNGTTGMVTVHFIVDRLGGVAAAWTNSTTTNGFERNAVRGVLRWKYAPAKVGENEVATHLAVDVIFNLADLK